MLKRQSLLNGKFAARDEAEAGTGTFSARRSECGRPRGSIPGGDIDAHSGRGCSWTSPGDAWSRARVGEALEFNPTGPDTAGQERGTGHRSHPTLETLRRLSVGEAMHRVALT